MWTSQSLCQKPLGSKQLTLFKIIPYTYYIGMCLIMKNDIIKEKKGKTIIFDTSYLLFRSPSAFLFMLDQFLARFFVFAFAIRRIAPNTMSIT